MLHVINNYINVIGNTNNPMTGQAFMYFLIDQLSDGIVQAWYADGTCTAW